MGSKKTYSLYSKRTGSITVIVICLFVAIVALSSGLLSSSGKRRYTTKKLNDVSLAREYACAIADLSLHYIRTKLLTDPNSDLRKKLEDVTKPQLQKDLKYDDIKDTFSQSSTILNKLVEANDRLRDLKCNKIQYELNKDDFEQFDCKINNSYPREKAGLIRISIEVSYKAPGSNNRISERYLFATKVKVTAALIPVLSRFNLYIEKALDGSDDSEKFNELQVTSNGEWKTQTKYKAWKLNNGSDGNAFAKIDEIMNSQTGLVYLGSKDDKPIVMGISRAWQPTNTQTAYSEGMHLYQRGIEDCSKTQYPFKKYGGMFVLNVETGLADDNTGDSIAWSNLVFGWNYGNKLTRTSVLKLFGSGSDMSPTLVLGNVKARTLVQRRFQTSNSVTPKSAGLLSYLDKKDFDKGGSEDTYVAGFIGFLKNNGTNVSYDTYKSEMSSCLWEVAYNRALFYMKSGFLEPVPQKKGNYISSGDDLYKYATGDSSADYNKVPKPYDNIISGADLTNMSAFLDAGDLLINDSFKGKDFDKNFYDSRMSYYLTLPKKAELTGAMISNHLILDSDGGSKQLNYEGWLLVEPESGVSDLKLNEKLEYKRNCGIIAKKGNIVIDRDVERKMEGHIFQIVALDGNIIIKSSVNRLDAALCANNGEIKVEGDKSTPHLTINGNMVMKKVSIDSMQRGVNLNYDKLLSAQPNKEQPLLMCTIYDNLELAD